MPSIGKKIKSHQPVIVPYKAYWDKIRGFGFTLKRNFYDEGYNHMLKVVSKVKFALHGNTATIKLYAYRDEC